MRARIAWLIAAKELLEIRRDLRTVVLLVVLPALLYPLLLMGAARLGAAGIQSLSERTLKVRVVPPLPAEVEEALSGLEGVVQVGPEAPGPVDATVQIAGPLADDESPPVAVLIDGATEAGQAAARRLLDPLREARRKARDARLRARGIDDEELLVPAVDVIDTAPPERRGGFLLGRMMVPILIVILLLGAYYPAIEVTVGERERQTLRTLLCAPVDPVPVAAGKLLAVTLVALVAAAANLGGLFLTARIGVLGLTGFSLPLSSLLVTLALLVPMALYVAAGLMALAALTRNLREAQTLLGPVMLVLLLPAAIAAVPGIEAGPLLAAVPILGPALVMREVLSGQTSITLVVVSLGASVLTAGVALALAARAFTVEALVTGRVSPPSRVAGPLPVFDAVLLTLGLGAGFVYVGVPLQQTSPVLGLAITQLVVFGGLPLGLAWLRAEHPARALLLNLRPARGTAALTVGGLLLLPGIGALITPVAQELLDPAEREAFEELGKAFLDVPWPLTFLTVAVLPGLCEELAFRGALLGAFSRRSPWVGILLSASLFALFHGSVARLPPTLVLGLLFSVVAWRARSVLPTMLLHVSHNGLALGLALALERAGGEAGASPYSILPDAVLFGSGVAGLALLGFGFARSRGAEADPGASPTSGPAAG